ncbi:hypothetical protein RUND412_002615 [Rhizina undulata]
MPLTAEDVTWYDPAIKNALTPAERKQSVDLVVDHYNNHLIEESFVRATISTGLCTTPDDQMQHMEVDFKKPDGESTRQRVYL